MVEGDSARQNMSKNLQTISTGEIWDIRKEIYKQDYFFNSSLEVICRHFLGYFSGFENIFSSSFDDVRKQFIISYSGFKEVPIQEDKFFEFIASEYFHLERAPYKCLLNIYGNAKNHINQIRENISYCKQERKKLEASSKDSQQKSYLLDEENSYNLGMFSHYIELNEIAEQQIINFIFSERIYETAHLRAQKDNFGINNRPSYSFEWKTKTYDPRTFSDVSNKFLALRVEQYREMQKIYKQDKRIFYNHMHEYIQKYEVVNEITFLLEKSHFLDKRSYILNPTLEQYKQGNNSIFCTLLLCR